MLFFFFNDTATTEIYTLSLHDALPISACLIMEGAEFTENIINGVERMPHDLSDRKSGSAGMPRPISYAVFCLKKKNDAQVECGHHLYALRIRAVHSRGRHVSTVVGTGT